jgi:ADP-L-glycero-D-manno-heptose 6-epimerase
MIVVTGGAGFIGSCLISKLNAEKRSDIIVVDHLGKENKWVNLSGKRFSRYYHKDDFRIDLYGDAFDDIDTIVHLGACSATTERNADYIMDNNLNYTVDLAEYALRNDIRFIYASSAATYGNGMDGYSDKEIYGLRPLNAYGLSKQLFDQWADQQGVLGRMAGIKFFNVFGPNEYHKGSMSSMVYKSFNQIKETGKVGLFKSNDPNYPDGGQMRDFIYVKDCVDVMMKMIDNKKINGIYNLGTGKARTWNSLIESVFQAMGLPTNIEYVEMPDLLKNQYQNFTEADMDKSTKTFGGIKFKSLEESVKDYVQNYLLKEWQYM